MKHYTESTVTARGLEIHADGSNQHLATVSINCEASRADAARLAACWNACHGLDLPADVPPGAVAALVAAARATLAAIERQTFGDPRPDAGGVVNGSRLHAELSAALAPFTADHVPPVSPPVPDRYVLARYTGDEWEDDTDREGCRWIVAKWVIDPDEGNHWETAGGTRFEPDEVERPQLLPGLVSPPTVPDARYTVTVENTGRATPCHVARFCGDWIGRADTHEGAVALCNAAYAKRMGNPAPPDEDEIHRAAMLAAYGPHGQG